MTVATCPQCAESVTVPAGVTAETRVSCPLCQEELSGDDFLHQLPPSLVLLDPPAAILQPLVDEPVDEPVDEAIGSGEMDLDPDNPFGEIREGDGGAAVIKRVRRTSTSRDRQSSKGGSARQIISVILGGLLALPIAQLILWQLNRDPIELVEKWSLRDVSWLQWALPRDDSPADPATSDKKQPKGGTKVSELEVPKASEFYDNGVNQYPNTELDKMTRPSSPDSLDRPNGRDAPGFDIPVPFEPGLAPALEPEPGKAPRGEWIEGAPVCNGLILAAMLDRTRESIEELDNAGEDIDAAAREQLEQRFCAMLAKLAYAVTFADQTEQQAKDQVMAVDQLLASVLTSQSKLDLIAQYGKFQYSSPQDGLNGIALVGEIVEIRERTPFFETVLRLPGEELPVEVIVVSHRNPSPLLKQGQQVIILGSATLQPKEIIIGYKGTAEQVVWGGYPLVISQPGNE